MTYSILLADGVNVGFGVQSHFPAVGPVVGRARSGVGAAVVQASGSGDLADHLLDRIEAGDDVETALAALLAEDPTPERRQVAVIDVAGNAAGADGARCIPIVASQRGRGIAVQGNCLTSPEVVAAMYEAPEGADTPARKLIASLGAAERAGGEIRGQWAAAICVATPEGVADVDLRVDDDHDAVRRLERLLYIHEGFAILRDDALMADPDRIADAIIEVRTDTDRSEVAIWLGVTLALRHQQDSRAAELVAPLVRADARWRALLSAIGEVDPIGALAPDPIVTPGTPL